MERRNLLRWSGSLATLTAISWLAGCENERPRRLPDSSDPPQPPAPPPKAPPATFEEDPFRTVELDLAGTLQRARDLGKPALIFVADHERGFESRDRAALFARFLRDTKDAAWSDLALCELACGAPDEIRNAIPGAVIDGKPYVVMVEHDAGKARLAVVDLPPPVPFDRSWRASVRRDSLKLDLDRWRSTLHDVIAGDSAALHRRAAAARQALGAEAVERVEAALRSSEAPTDAMLAGAPALVLLEAEERPETGMRHKLTLEQRTRIRVLQEGVSGAGWARDSSCGPSTRLRHGKSIAGSSHVGMACGMGSISEFGSNFLWYYSDGSR